MKKIENLSQFKKALQVGIKLQTTHHTFGNMGVREVSIVQSNSFALETIREGKKVDSWCEYPKSKDLICNGSNEVTVFWGEGEKREAVLTYKFI